MSIVIGMLMTAQVAAGATTPLTAPAARKSQQDRMVCVEAQQLGTRLGGHRICRTKAEWDQDRQNVRADTENAQRTNIHE